MSALVLALLSPTAAAQSRPSQQATGDADTSSPSPSFHAPSSVAPALPSPPAAAPPSAPSPPPQPAQAPPSDAYNSGLSPFPGDAEVPLAFMPPGTAVSPVPSDEIFPPQTIPLRFNHRKHVQELKQPCKSCHAAAFTSRTVTDRLLPAGTQCDSCHDVDHRDLNHVEAGTDANGQCSYCHLGENAGAGGKVAHVVIPHANLRFPHDKHLARNIQCGQCHGQVGELELATRDQLPRMAGCFTCHNMSGAAQGEAKGECTVCHLTQPDGRLVQSFSTGDLLPPRWLHNAAHTADWIERHKIVAGANSELCASCHSPQYCADCHDGRVRPRKVHPNDWLSMHPQAARQDNPRCVSCHQQQTFCADCHRRTGVARDVASGNRPVGRRFHPPPAEWTLAPRGAKHHAWEAERNLNACVSCHTERDCVTCHATKGLSGGQGVNPHPLGFEHKCRAAFTKNPRPCLVCHQSNDSFLRNCR
ncbi:cytochrome c3 family protein [Chondromyces crocatus]|nr:cytochrome c3 family protein [Chondromyces crocatus]